MKTFTMCRRGDLSQTHSADQANAPDEPQFEGVVFSDGRVAVRWMTAVRSVSVWDSLDDLMAIHGHPEYDSELVWHEPGLAQQAWLAWMRILAGRSQLKTAQRSSGCSQSVPGRVSLRIRGQA